MSIKHWQVFYSCKLLQRSHKKQFKTFGQKNKIFMQEKIPFELHKLFGRDEKLFGFFNQLIKFLYCFERDIGKENHQNEKMLRNVL
jgi:hypothetical protein